ncbi:hypothetical protein AVMA1855_12090 [Acidovorax sp. SUPP1855]|uniref:hypothetical protein n=1 Tax=Acidovorax sp. SUPP1855 TaxID=431774 RepID=UPI0023DE672B|nr:hypothetical protein [Acidovorax sp. SUPP1855]GKS84892.1 hypothetical protein AVMA1855_12090 [Acidovorax sp. SUPP1855]
MSRIALMAFLALPLGATASESLLTRQVESLPLSVQKVETCGAWTQADRAGYYRVVVVDVHEGAGSEIYVQWLTQPTQERRSELVRTLAFPELNDDHSQYAIQEMRCRKVGSGIEIAIKAQYEHDTVEKTHAIRVLVKAAGTYAISGMARGSQRR